MESSTATPPGHDEKRLAELGYKQSLNRAWSGFSNFAISFTIISILAGCFTTYGQAWNNGGPIAISGLAADLDPDPDHRVLPIGAGLRLPDGGRDLLVRRGGSAAPAPGLVHRLVQPDRPRGRGRLGRLRLRDLPQRRPRPLRSEHLRDQLRRRSPHPRGGIPPVRADPAHPHDGQHLPAPTCSRSSTASRSGGTCSVSWRSSWSWYSSRTPIRASASSSATGSTTVASAKACTGSTYCRSASS